MSCSNCDCEECRMDRELDEDLADHDFDYLNDPNHRDDSPPPPPLPPRNFKPVRVTNLPPPKAPPPTAKMRGLIEESFNSIWKDFPEAKSINMAAMTQLVFSRIACGDISQYRLITAQIEDFLRDKARDPNSGYAIFRGAGGGFTKL